VSSAFSVGTLADEPCRARQPDVRRGHGEQHVLWRGPQRAQHQEHRLLAADGDDDRLRVDVDLVVDSQVPRDQLVDDPLRPSVLEQRPPHPRRVEAAIRQVRDEPPQIQVQVLDVVELLVRPPGGERHRVRVVAGDLVQERHRGERRVLQ
jgi:hypothetical protein